MAHCLHGTGMYMTTECMPMYSLHIPTACGGTGDGRPVSMARVGDSASAGTLHGIHHGTRLGITEDGILLGMQVIGATGAVIGVATGGPDGIITIIIIIRIMDGADRYITTTIHEKPTTEIPAEISVTEIPSPM